MRFLNILLVCMAIGVLATGAYVLGSKVKRDADDELTTPITASAAAATAESNLKPALYAANAYYVDNSSYRGMTADVSEPSTTPVSRRPSRSPTPARRASASRSRSPAAPSATGSAAEPSLPAAAAERPLRPGAVKRDRQPSFGGDVKLRRSTTT